MAEIRHRHTHGHWNWHVFPQIDGLGRSSAEKEFALRGLDEACTYLRDPILRSHYEEIAPAVAEQLVAGISYQSQLNTGL